jgi:hypothetical protein
MNLTVEHISSVPQLFICYTRDEVESKTKAQKDKDAQPSWNEVSAIWTLVQWGIPTNPVTTPSTFPTFHITVPTDAKRETTKI